LLLLSGSETGDAGTATVGTLARITDWYQGSDGILGITAMGTRKFNLDTIEQQVDGLYVGRISLVDSEPVMKLPARFQPMAELLNAILDDLGKLYGDRPRRLDDATWVGCRFAEILPMSLEQRQHCLELDDPMARLEIVQPMLQSVRWETRQ
jgi:Lon protease-like protein